VDSFVLDHLDDCDSIPGRGRQAGENKNILPADENSLPRPLGGHFIEPVSICSRLSRGKVIKLGGKLSAQQGISLGRA
jgi:hypothetical protein